MRYLGFFVVAVLVMGASHRYVWARLVRDAGLPQPWSRVATVAIVVLYVLLMGSFVLVRTLHRSIGAPLMWITYTWLGVLFFMVLSLGLSDLARVITMRVQGSGTIDDPERRMAISRLFAGGAAMLGLGASAVGLASVLAPVAVKRVKVTLDRLTKASSGTRIVQLTDVHVGPTIGKAYVDQVVQRVNELDADVVVITGDLVDGSVEDLKEHVAPLGTMKNKHGIYFVTGNHEYYSGAGAWIRYLESIGIKVLANEHVRIGGADGFDLVGIDDPSSGTQDLRKALEGREADRACVLLSHQPRGIALAEKLGVDLQLSGHTHGGQLFPWNFMVRLQQPFVAGLHKLERAQIYVSSGTGYWGPPMRVGTSAEITEIELLAS
ncbi:MAG: metallophosphoesterase [Labilithrix sp.]|nr:metallophosphoesterase [Labilithrix sp.]MCW5811403.1 metallophosphoesterase [Labilithrix sp.]